MKIGDRYFYKYFILLFYFLHVNIPFCFDMVPTVLSRERMIVARRTRRQWKDLNEMDLYIVQMLFLKVTGQVKVRLKTKIPGSHSPAAPEALS